MRVGYLAAVLCFLASLTVPFSVSAQVVSGDPGDMNLSFSEDGTLTWLEPEPFSAFELHVVLWGVDDVFGFEYSYSRLPTMLLDNQTGPNPRFITGDATFCNCDSPFNVKAGTGICVEDRSLYVLMSVSFIYFAHDGPVFDEVLCLGPADPPSPAAQNHPAYLSCDEQIISATSGVTDPNGVYPDNCIILWPTSEPPVPNDTISWGSVKAAYEP